MQTWRMVVFGVVPGSHRIGEIVEHRSELSRHGSWTKVDEAQAVDLVIPAGTVVLFSANLLHGAYDNHSKRTRYSTAWHYMPDELNPEKVSEGNIRRPACGEEDLKGRGLGVGAGRCVYDLA